MIDFADALNEQQHAAVTHGDGPQLVIAGAGSGKTRVITYRIAWLVETRGVDPSEITAVTFTNKAAGEMRDRVEELLGQHPLRAFVGTFHRFALWLLRRWGDRVGLDRDFTILDADDQKRLIKLAIAAEGLDERAFSPGAVLGVISGAKNRLLDPATYERTADDYFHQRVSRVYRGYQRRLLEANGIDFDDMIRLSVRLLRAEDKVRERIVARCRYLLVDEFQDTNHAQLALIRALVGEDGNLTAVGDEDQGIYRWRGAELENILRFERSFPSATVRKLERNYRSTQIILDAAGAVVDRNQGRRGKRLWTDAGDGEALRLYVARDETDEARWITRTLAARVPARPWSDMAVLVRTNAQTRAVEDAFNAAQVPYNLVGGVRFYERAEVKDVVAYLRLLRNPRDPLSFSRVLNRPPRGIGKTSHDRLLAQARARETTPWDLLEAEDLGEVSGRGRKALLAFRDLIRGLRDEADRLPLASLLRILLERTDYLAMYKKGDPEADARIENVQELLSAAEDFAERETFAGEEDLLTAFLDHVALVSDVDALDRGRGVTLMTLHSAKGLEFPVVVLAGLEDGVLPHFNAQADPEGIEEERRLLYVGMTRAERTLMLTTCRRRRVAGRYQDQSPSRFLAEIPDRFVDTETSPELFETGGYGDPRSRGAWSGGGRYGGETGYGEARPNRPRFDPPRPGQPRATTGTAASNVYSFFGGGSSAGGSEDADPEPVDDVPVWSAERPVASSSPPARRPPGAEGAIRQGSKVRHVKLGIGTVMKLEGSGDDLRLIVYFNGVGRRKLVARYAQLDVL